LSGIADILQSVVPTKFIQQRLFVQSFKQKSQRNAHPSGISVTSKSSPLVTGHFWK